MKSAFAAGPLTTSQQSAEAQTEPNNAGTAVRLDTDQENAQRQPLHAPIAEGKTTGQQMPTALTTTDKSPQISKQTTKAVGLPGKIQVLQINLHTAKAAHSLLQQTTLERQIKIILASEPNLKASAGKNWYNNKSGGAAVWVAEPQGVTDSGAGDSFVWVAWRGVVYYSCYYPPNTSMREYQDTIDQLTDDARGKTLPVLIGGDFNAKSPEWGSTSRDTRGDILADAIASLDMSICNTGRRPTFKRGQHESVIDVTVVTAELQTRSTEWEVLEDETGSDHNYIFFVIRAAKTTPKVPRGWNTKKLNIEKALQSIQDSLWHTIETAEELVEEIKRICEASMPRKRIPQRRSVYWWNDEVDEARKKCMVAGRLYMRHRGRNHPAEAAMACEARKVARKAMTLAIRKSQENSWQGVITDIDNDTWGLGYRIVAKKLASSQIPGLTSERITSILDTLFPTHDSVTWAEAETIEPPPPFTREELLTAAQKAATGKAPGPDCIPNEIIKVMAAEQPDTLLRVINSYAARGEFPKIWKRAMLVLLRKGDKPLDLPSSYRPICLLDNLGKLYERLIQQRITEDIRRLGDLNDRQYGFRKKRSTIDAVQRIVERAAKSRDGPGEPEKL